MRERTRQAKRVRKFVFEWFLFITVGLLICHVSVILFKMVDNWKLLRAFTAVELKNYNAILAPPIYQKSSTAVEAKQNFFADLLQCTSIYRCAL